MISDLFAASGQTLLRPVVESAQVEVTYLEARVARAFLSRDGRRS